MSFDFLLLFYLVGGLILSYGKVFPLNVTESILIVGTIVGTIPIVISALRSLSSRKVTVDLLASVALIFSMIDSQWSSASFICLMITSARIFGQYTENKARNAIRSLLTLRPDTVMVKRGKEIVTIYIESVNINDFVVVEAGGRVPVDGTIVEGEASIDQSSLTGESIPIVKTKGEKVLSSTLNVSGSITIRAEKVGKDTTFEKIIELVEHAQSGKAGIQTMADTFSSYYILGTFGLAIILYIWTHNMSFVLAILLVTCADDIAVALPLAFWAAITRAAKRGIIIKGGNFLEALPSVRTVVFDKTGTVTKGKIAVHDIVPFSSFSKDKLIHCAAYTSVVSNHPVARAVFSYAMKKKGKRNLDTPIKFKEFPGKGMIAYEKNAKIMLGNERFFKEQGIALGYEAVRAVSREEEKGLSVVFVAHERTCMGYITLADELRDNMKGVISGLRHEGVERIVMLTGDNERVARRIADEVGISEYHSSMLPEDKVAFIQKSVRKKDKLMMVGDGVNDAAALARADIGVAMGVIGSDATIESSDIALMKDDMKKIIEAIHIGRFTLTVAKENFIIWGVVNGIGLVLVFLHILGPEGAAAYNFATDFIPILNSFRVFTKKSFITS